MIHSATSELIKAAIDLNWLRLNDDNVRRNRVAIGDAAYLHEYATIQLNFGRQVGHSTYIKEHAQANDLVVVRVQDDVKRFHTGRVLTLRQILNYGGSRGFKFDRVWVDTASHVFKNGTMTEGEFYQLMAASGVNQIIMLG